MKPISNDKISTYWWNFRKRQHEFTGTISEYLKLKGIKSKSITSPVIDGKEAFKFTFELSGRKIIFISPEFNFSSAALEAIQLFLTILGDKALITGFKTMCINFK